MPICFDLNKVRNDYNCNIYFETGLWNVVTEETSLCQALKLNFDKCASVEINNKFINLAKEKFIEEIKNDKLFLFEGDSKNLNNYLQDLSIDKNDKILFFLDSHGSGHGCPLVEELTAIKELESKNHIIMIDDVRIIRGCIWGDQRYNNANFESELKNKILEINPNYEFSYLNGYQENDVLIASLSE
tara:strand:- start:4881 stop:5441 length:561 start_codon:yes stop_codon:yes gene_type:complete